MTYTEVARFILLAITGVCMFLFGTSMVVQSRHDWRRAGWRNVPWGGLAGCLTLSIGIGYLLGAFRVTPLTGRSIDNELALYMSGVTAVLSALTVRRWFRSERTKR